MGGDNESEYMLRGSMKERNCEGCGTEVVEKWKKDMGDMKVRCQKCWSDKEEILKGKVVELEEVIGAGQLSQGNDNDENDTLKAKIGELEKVLKERDMRKDECMKCGELKDEIRELEGRVEAEKTLADLDFFFIEKTQP